MMGSIWIFLVAKRNGAKAIVLTADATVETVKQTAEMGLPSTANADRSGLINQE